MYVSNTATPYFPHAAHFSQQQAMIKVHVLMAKHGLMDIFISLLLCHFLLKISQMPRLEHMLTE